jgi:hypothetical protein
MDKKAIKVAGEFVRRVNKHFKIKKAIAFGSRVRGDYLEWSDVDVLLVSEDFEGIEFTERMSRMYEYWKSDYPLEVLCYTPEEFEKKRKQICIVREAVQEGVELV